jgi:catechol 2,3-dioxygenase-like lactoylglutathione lyase family enzyme
MRLDHIAFRVPDRHAAAKLYTEFWGYKVQKEFDIDFGDGTTARCIALEPPEKTIPNALWQINHLHINFTDNNIKQTNHELQYHLAPEIFVSDGTEGSIVGDWVKARGGVGGVHHMAYQCSSEQEVRNKAKEWVENGFGEFSGDVLTCDADDLNQIFTKCHPATGIIYEFIHRGKHGFCEANVRNLMLSSKNDK